MTTTNVAPEPDLATLVGSTADGTVTLGPQGKEFKGPLVIRRPLTINGLGGTIWAEKGPVLVIESAGVVLTDLNVEVTGTEDTLQGDEACAIVARTAPPTLTRVAVRGHVAGIGGEAGEWRYPRIVRLNKVRANTPHTFALRLVVPVPCRFDSLVAGVRVEPADLPAGTREVRLLVEPMTEGIRLKGLLRLSTPRLTRRIELSGHVAADGAGVITGTGQSLFQPPVPPSAKKPDPPTKKPDPPAKKPDPLPAPVPPAAAAAEPQKQKSRYRTVSPSASSLFVPPAPPAGPETTPAEGETASGEPPAAAAPAADSGAPPDNNQKKSTHRRNINRLSNLFGDPPASPATD